MKHLVSSRLAFAMLLLGATFSVAEEDLDAALEAQKKKAQRRVYSERALIKNRNIVVPKTQSEEERALDRDLKKLENQLSSQLIPASEVRVPRRRAPVPVKTKNWLTPTLLDSEKSDGLFSEKNAPSWIDQELDRQKEIQMHKKELAEEEALVNKMLREDSRPKISTDRNLFKPYEPILRNSLSPADPNPASTYSVFSPSKVILPKEKKSPSTASLFSPTARANSGVIKPAFSSPSSGQRPDWRPQFGSSVPKPASDFRSDWDDLKPKPLPPLKRARQSSPIYRKDPFSDDFIPEIKTSIWD
jgi:hypothetical protein